MKKLSIANAVSKVRMCLAHITYESYHISMTMSLLLGCVVFVSLYTVEAVAPTINSTDVNGASYHSVETTCTVVCTEEVITTTTVTAPTTEFTSTSTTETTTPVTFAESVPTSQTVLEVTDCAEVYTEPEAISYYITESQGLTESEVYLLASLVQREGGSEPYECKLAIASTVVNRMVLTNSTLSDVLYAPGQFTTASRLASTTPSDECIQAATEVASSGTTLPVYVIFFRAGYYHSWGDQQPYTQLGSTYFSYSQATKEANS